jgi:hypothetical protein
MGVYNYQQLFNWTTIPDTGSCRDFLRYQEIHQIQCFPLLHLVSNAFLQHKSIVSSYFVLVYISIRMDILIVLCRSAVAVSLNLIVLDMSQSCSGPELSP